MHVVGKEFGSGGGRVTILFFLAAPGGMWDLSSLTRGLWNPCPLHWKADS